MEQQQLAFGAPEPMRQPNHRAAGRALAELGAERAADRADRELGDWSEQAWAFFEAFARRRQGRSFMAEDVRAAAQGVVPVPPDGRAWGAILLRASKRKLIRRTGFAPMKAANCHANPKSVWVWVGE
jgi:hypothetical protein